MDNEPRQRAVDQPRPEAVEAFLKIVEQQIVDNGWLPIAMIACVVPEYAGTMTTATAIIYPGITRAEAEKTITDLADTIRQQSAHNTRTRIIT